MDETFDILVFLRDKTNIIYNERGIFINILKTNTEVCEFLKKHPLFSKGSTVPGAIGELSNYIIVEEKSVKPNIVELWNENELMGEVLLNNNETPSNQAKYLFTTSTIKERYEEETVVVNKWVKSGFLVDYTENDRPLSEVSYEFEKAVEYLDSLHGSYFIDKLSQFIFPLMAYLLKLKTNGKQYPFEVYDIILFSNFYYPQIENVLKNSNNPDNTEENIPSKASLIMAEYYPSFLDGVKLMDFLAKKIEEYKNGK
jgi:hypothetical protein